jgi:allantoinase
MRYDLIVRGGTVITPSGVAPADIAIADGAIVVVEPELAGAAAEEIDASGLHVFPGLIDAHVHFNEPGRAAWEGWATGSTALAVGGGTLAFEMPLNANPPTCDAASFALKRSLAEASSLTDFALWGGLVPGNLDQLEDLAAAGAIGFKAFMSASGTPEFAAADDLTLFEGMARAAQLALPVAVHAESDMLTSALAARAIAAGRLSVRDYLESRPVIAELEAIQRALLFAAETGCRLHVVHVSSGRGVALISEARARGVDVSCETCPHYLVFTGEDVERVGAAAKCSPPIRDAAERGELWEALLAGEVDLIASDHSPAPASMKGDTPSGFFGVWGGIAGVQSTLELLLTEGHHRRGLGLATVGALIATRVAERFGLSKKGSMTTGGDADLALVDLGASWTLSREDLRDRHRLSPYVGMAMAGRVVRTLRRGQTIAREGQAVGSGGGMLVRP